MAAPTDPKSKDEKAMLQDKSYNVADFAPLLLAWYDVAGRHLPWRARWPHLTDAYDVFLSELMLQQTVVATVIPYFQRFKSRWPTIHDLAACEEADLLREWAGLGYYARARNMHKAAKIIAGELGGDFPQDEDSLVKLPGIGPYTAAAIAAFAFDKAAIVLDGNVERVLARYSGDETPLPALKETLRALYPALQPKERHSDFPQAIMDLGARVCIPKAPRCDICPLVSGCAMAGKKEAALLPVKPAKKAKPKRDGVIFIATFEDKAVMIRRPNKGLLGGLMIFPTKGWFAKDEAKASIEDAPFYQGQWIDKAHSVKHVFTHFELTLTIYHLSLDEAMVRHILSQKEAGFALVSPDDVGLASVMKKAWDLRKI